MDSAETTELKETMRNMIKKQIQKLKLIKLNNDKFLLILKSAVEDL
jgi:hypothetical protein